MIFYLFVFLFADLIRSDEFCSKEFPKSDSIRNYCEKINGTLNNRCCWTTTMEIVGIDLTNLNLNEIPSLNSSIRFIDLRLNSQVKQRKDFDFLQLQQLEDLFLPEHYSCPGDKNVWISIEHLTNSSLLGFHCHGQKDFCSNRTDICPSDRSFCNCNGPNHFLCLCRSGFYGFKCLRHGDFPYGRFLGATTVITIILSTIFYWTHRRNVITAC